MIVTGYISQRNDVHYYYTMVHGKITVEAYSGPEGPLKHKLDELGAQTMLALFEDFLLIDRDIVDRGKDVHIYSEIANRIKKYIEWGHQNISIAPRSVMDNGHISRKYMNKMIDMVSDDHSKKKELIFIENCVTQTYENAYKLNKD